MQLTPGAGAAEAAAAGLSLPRPATSFPGSGTRPRATGVRRTPRPLGDREQIPFAMPYAIAVGSAVAGAIEDAGSITGPLYAVLQRLAGYWKLPDGRPPRPAAWTRLFRV